VAGTVYWGCYAKTVPLTWQEWVFGGAALIYLSLALAVRWTRFGALVSGFLICVWLGVYVGDLNPRGGNIFRDGRIIELPILGIFLWAVWREIWRDDKNKRLPRLETKPVIKLILLILGALVSGILVVSANSDLALRARLLPT